MKATSVSVHLRSNSFRLRSANIHHGMEEWLIIQNFFHCLNQRSQNHMDAIVGGAFLSLDVAGARVLIDKVVSSDL